MSQDVFQSKIDQTFEGCEGVIGIADDIVVAGKSEEEHVRRLHEVISRRRSTGLKLNPEKCKIKEQKIKFYGVVCGQDGIHPDPSKVSALKGMAAPNNVKGATSFSWIGDLYVSIRSISEQSNNFSTRNAKRNKRIPVVTRAPRSIQEDWKQISEEVTLSYFNPDKEVVLQVDASMIGLGASLLQANKP